MEGAAPIGYPVNKQVLELLALSDRRRLREAPPIFAEEE